MLNVVHMGITKLYLQLRQQYYSPKLRQMVKDIVQTCPICQPVKPLHPSNQKPIKMARLLEPCSSYSMDLYGPLTDKTDNTGSLLHISYLSKNYGLVLLLLFHCVKRPSRQSQRRSILTSYCH